MTDKELIAIECLITNINSHWMSDKELIAIECLIKN